MISNIVETNDIPSVAIGFMNDTHQEEVDLVNAIGKLLVKDDQSGTLQTEISKQLNNWLEHTQAHFARENKLMQQVSFPAYSVHMGEHESALNHLETIISDWEQNKNVAPLKEYLFSQWPAWFVNHVNTMDKITAQFALANGYSEP